MCTVPFVKILSNFFRFIYSCVHVGLLNVMFQLFSLGTWYLPFILELEHIGVIKSHAPITEAAHLLSQICPAHKLTMEKLQEALLSQEDTNLRNMMFGPTPPTVAYNIEVCVYANYETQSKLSKRLTCPMGRSVKQKKIALRPLS